MSIDLMTQVWKSDAYDGGTLLVLLALADWADDDGGNIFPKVATMAKKARLCERQVQNCLKAMRDDQVLIKVAEARRGRGTEYRLDIERVKQLRRNYCVAKTTGEVGFAKGVKRASGEGVKPNSPPIREPSGESPENHHSGAPGGASERWKEFRAAVVETWPGKFPSDDEAKARKAFERAAETITADTLIACARAHGAAKTAQKVKRSAPGEFLMKLPSNWLKECGFSGYAEGAAADQAAEAEIALSLGRAHSSLGAEMIDILRRIGMTETEMAKMAGATFLGGSQPCFTVVTPFQGALLRRHAAKLQRELGTEELVIVLAGSERRSA